MSVRVLIVEDSPTITKMLQSLIDSDSRLTVVGAASTGEEALSLVESLRPDVISMDLQLPGISGLDTVREIMSERPTPLVVVAQNVDKATFEALRCGVLSLVEKPAGSGAAYQASCQAICDQLFLMSAVKVMRFRPQKSVPLNASQAKLELDRQTPCRFEVLGIGASNGSTPSLTRLLGSLPRRFELPVLIAQRTPEPAATYAEWLQSMTSLPVRVASAGEIPLPGYVYLAPPGEVLSYEERRLHLSPGPVEQTSDILFHSFLAIASKALAILLAGTTDDGRVGLEALGEAGGETILESGCELLPGERPRAVSAGHRLTVGSIPREVLRLLR